MKDLLAISFQGPLLVAPAVPLDPFDPVDPLYLTSKSRGRLKESLEPVTIRNLFVNSQESSLLEKSAKLCQILVVLASDTSFASKYPHRILEARIFTQKKQKRGRNYSCQEGRKILHGTMKEQ